MPKLFDKPKGDIFDRIELPKLEQYKAPPRVAVNLTDEIRSLIRSEIANHLKSRVTEIVKEVKPERVIETKVIEKEMVSPPERVIVKEVDTKSLEKAVADRLAMAMKDYEKNWKNIAPIVVPNGIPNMDGQGGKVLSNDGRIAKWITNTGGGGGTSSDAYTVNNVTTDRSYDASLTSLDEIANVLGSLIQSLQGAGIIQ